MRTESTTVPLARPPCAVGLVVLELTREEDGDEDFVHGTLNGDDCDQPKYGVRCVPELEEPLRNAIS